MILVGLLGKVDGYHSISSRGVKPLLNNICISDRVYNYLQQIKKKQIGVNSDEAWYDIYELYKDLRVDGFLGNHNPITISGAIVYTIIMKREIAVTQSDLAECVGCSEGSIRKNYNIIQEYLGLKTTTKRTDTIYPIIKGKYNRIDLDRSKAKVPINQIMKDRWCCKNNFHDTLYVCKICDVGLYHLQNIPEHYKKKHENKIPRTQEERYRWYKIMGKTGIFDKLMDGDKLE